MENYHHYQSFELLCLLAFSGYNELSEQELKSIGQLADQLSSYHSTNAFNKIFTDSKEEGAQQLFTSDDLFVKFDNLKLVYTNRDILSLHDKIIIYTCLLGWVKELNLTAIDIKLTEKILSLGPVYSELLSEFFIEERQIIQKNSSGLFLIVPNTEEKENLDGDWVKSNIPQNHDKRSVVYCASVQSKYYVLFIKQLRLFLVRRLTAGNDISKNGEEAFCKWEFLQPGDTISEKELSGFNYNFLKANYIEGLSRKNVVLAVNNISYNHLPGRGIEGLNLNIKSGTMVGVLGREGTGKSTILNLLAGEILPEKGDIIINGYHYRKELYHLKGMIGYVPEEDMLFDELTVYDNLYYSAKLYLGNLSDDKIRSRVMKLLRELDLWMIRYTVVGSYKNKHLQPGQRRMLNIALELIRDPQLLIVDNAIATLSLSDSSKIIDVLSEFSFRGRIVITTITQTDRKTFQNFDKILLLDEGGLPIIFDSIGNVWEKLSGALGLEMKKLLKPEPNEILELLDSPVNNEQEGEALRYKSSPEWYKEFSINVPQSRKETSRKIVPEKLLQPPTLERQYWIFSLRNFKAKIARTRELIVTLAASPLLALFLSLFLRDFSNAEYSFYSNQNIPEFYFTSFIVAVFLGAVLAAKEIFREKLMIQKQYYLNISKFSYINSKITYLFIIALIQSFVFIAISHFILEISGFFLLTWLIFFSCQAFGVLIGLLLSENSKTLEAIYSRSIPVILLIQLIFGGGSVRLDTFPGGMEYTPILSDLSVVRWAQEAMMVYQFRENEYNKTFYEVDRDYSSATLNTGYKIPALKSDLEYCADHINHNPDSTLLLLKCIQSALNDYPRHFDIFPYENISLLQPETFTFELAADLADYLEYLELHFISLYKNAEERRMRIEQNITDSLGADYLQKLKLDYSNRAINAQVRNSDAEEVIIRTKGAYIQTVDQIFQYPHSDFGRAKLFLPEKMINGQIIDTVEFNISIIWLINLLLYVVLVTRFVEFIRRRL